MSWTFPLFRLFGIPVRAHWTLALLVGGYLVKGTAQDGLTGLERMAVTMGILLVSVLFHEFAHCWMALRRGGHAERVLLWPLGGIAYVGHMGSAHDDLKVAGIGPISSFVLGGLALGALLLTGVPWHWEYANPFEGWWYPDSQPYHMTTAHNFALHAFRLNMILGLFNLLIPAYPLDGGRVLFAFLTIRHGRRRAAEVTSLIAIPVGCAMVIWGIAQNEINLILIGAFVLIETFQLRWLLRMGELEAHPGFGSGPRELEYMPERERRPGFFARWRQKRARARAAREAEESARLRERVDQVLDKVSREGMGSLNADELKILEEASRRTRED